MLLATFVLSLATAAVPAPLAAVAPVASVDAMTGAATDPAALSSVTDKSRSCTGYTNYVTPPAFIRVLRQSGPSDGRTVKVPFRSWVKHVLGTQMPGYYPRETLRANAIFVKQYGWYYLLKGHWRGGRDSHGACYDVKDAGDGWYIPEQRSYTTTQSAAVDFTWNFTVRKWDVDHWKFFLTGYRSGAMVPCARDSDGWHLMQHSAFYCGKDGLSWRNILGRYLTKLRIVYRWEWPERAEGRRVVDAGEIELHPGGDLVHDFGDRALGEFAKAIPYGVYDVGNDEG